MPADDTVLTMAPPCSSMAGRTARHMRNVPVRLTAMISSHRLSDSSVVWEKEPIPAMLQRLVMMPSSSVLRATDVATACSSVTSHCRARALPPLSAASSFIFSATAATASSMSRQATAAPSAARRRAVARPMPDAAPVTTATRPS